ncbi:MAG: hypothetical protein U0Y68_16755 [Blastocatellia bacterium]
MWIFAGVSLVRGDDDGPLHYIFQLLDVTERKQSKKKSTAPRFTMR